MSGIGFPFPKDPEGRRARIVELALKAAHIFEKQPLDPNPPAGGAARPAAEEDIYEPSDFPDDPGDFLVDMYRTVSGLKLTEGMKADIRRGWWIRKIPLGPDERRTEEEKAHPYTISTKDKETNPQLDWCGIFATYILMKANLPVKWRQRIYSSNPNLMKVKQADFRKLIQHEYPEVLPGDVAVRTGQRVHHMVITGPWHCGPAESGIITFQTVEGNLGGVRPVARGSCRLEELGYFYSVYG